VGGRPVGRAPGSGSTTRSFRVSPPGGLRLLGGVRRKPHRTVRRGSAITSGWKKSMWGRRDRKEVEGSQEDAEPDHRVRRQKFGEGGKSAQTKEDP